MEVKAVKKSRWVDIEQVVARYTYADLEMLIRWDLTERGYAPEETAFDNWNRDALVVEVDIKGACPRREEKDNADQA